mmetsp:Transcript_14382/g.56579  ORF Transcript_14382/g.56579 Transcript_14382/m.56579 type:complete len:356 (+) Transcript_14382:33-1100(+)
MAEVSWAGRAQRFDTAEDAAELCAALEAAPGAERVVLSGNTFSVEAAAAVAQRLAGMAELRELDLADMFTTRLKEEVPRALEEVRAAVQAHPRLARVDCSDNALGAPGVAALAGLLAATPSLRTLALNNCGVGTAGAQVLADALAELGAGGVHADRLLLARNRLKDDGAQVLAAGLAHVPGLRGLQLNGNSIGAEGAAAVCRALGDKAGLEELDMNDNNFKEAGAAALLEALPGWPGLRALNLGDCMLEGRVGDLLCGLTSSCTRLEALDLSYDDIGEEEEELLVGLVKAAPGLSSLNVNGNCLRPATVAAIREALADADALGSLSDNEYFSDDDDGEEDGDLADLEARVQGMDI